MTSLFAPSGSALDALHKLVNNKSVIVTGGTGHSGKPLCAKFWLWHNHAVSSYSRAMSLSNQNCKAKRTLAAGGMLDSLLAI